MSGKHDFDDKRLELQLMEVTEDPTYAQTAQTRNAPAVRGTLLVNGDADQETDQGESPLLH